MKNNQNPTAIVRIHRPILTPEEHDKRMEVIKQAAAKLVIAARKAKV
jgi:hypothetical protein